VRKEAEIKKVIGYAQGTAAGDELQT